MISEVQLPDYYQLLGVQPGATQKEIDLAYQKLIGKFDSSEGQSTSIDQPTLKERIELAQDAYDTLSNKQKREAYDAVVEVKKGHADSGETKINKPGMMRSLRSKRAMRTQVKQKSINLDHLNFLE